MTTVGFALPSPLRKSRVAGTTNVTASWTRFVSAGPGDQQFEQKAETLVHRFRKR